MRECERRIARSPPVSPGPTSSGSRVPRPCRSRALSEVACSVALQSRLTLRTAEDLLAMRCGRRPRPGALVGPCAGDKAPAAAADSHRGEGPVPDVDAMPLAELRGSVAHNPTRLPRSSWRRMAASSSPAASTARPTPISACRYASSRSPSRAAGCAASSRAARARWGGGPRRPRARGGVAPEARRPSRSAGRPRRAKRARRSTSHGQRCATLHRTGTYSGDGRRPHTWRPGALRGSGSS